MNKKLPRKKYCIFCAHVLRADGTCQNPECPRYTPEVKNTDKKEEPSNK